MTKLVVLSLALAVVCVAAGSCPNVKNMNEQHDFDYKGKKVDFEKPYPIPAAVPDKTPDTPVCTLFGQDLEVHEIFQRDTDKANKDQPGGWSCRIDNLSQKNYVVRVQTTVNHRNPKKEAAWDFYYYVPAGGSTLANPGHGGDKMVCRLCGAAEANQEYLVLAESKKSPGSKKSWNDMGPLEWSTYNFQCRRRCSVVLYQHRNFNGKSLTISSPARDLTKGELVEEKGQKPLVSSLKIFGKGCEVRMWEDIDFKADDKILAEMPIKPEFRDDTYDPVCKITSQSDIEAWDMDALRKRCCNQRCPSGQDCFKSVSIRDKVKCGAAAMGTENKPKGCPRCHVSKRNDLLHVPVKSRVAQLERLFQAMADVLEA